MSHLKFRFGLLAAASLFGPALVALPAAAADLDAGYADIPQPVAQQNVEFGSGWYVRGDIGLTQGLVPRTRDDPYDYTTSSYITGVDPTGHFLTYETLPNGIYEGPGRTPPSIVSGGSVDLAYTASLGGGYQFNKWFRSDVVFDFNQPTKMSTTGTGRDCITGETAVTITENNKPVGTYEYPTVTTCTPTYQAALRSYDALVNGYFDIGTWGPVTPYVGAGIGLSFGHANASSTYVMANGLPYQITFHDALNGATYYQNWDRTSSTQYYNIAFALMAGFSVDVFDHTKLDIGYRYLNLGKVLGTTLNTQQVRAGLRYMVDN